MSLIDSHLHTTRHLISLIIIALFMTGIVHQAHAAKSNNPKAGKTAQPAKERLVLMPLRLEGEDQKLHNTMESALVEGLQQKYTVLWGEEVEKKAKEIFRKENLKHECNEERCMQGIAEAFQSELLANANITKQEGGYFLTFTIQNLYDHIVIFTKSLPCEGCTAFKAVDKLKELGIAAAPVTTEESQPKVAPNDREGALWNEVQKGNSIDDYAAYLEQFPKGKFAVLARSRMKKLQEQAAAEQAQQDQRAWENATDTATEAGYQDYLRSFPQGQYAGLVPARIKKLQSEQTAREEQSLWQTIQNSEDGKTIQNYLDRYPNGLHAAAARDKLTAIRKQAEAAALYARQQAAERKQASASSFIASSANGEMPLLAKQNNCSACHAINRQIVGPAWADVASRYKSASSFEYNGRQYPLVEGLMMKVSRGGSGHWGRMPMPANDPAGGKQDEIRQLVQFILGLAK
jgi:cytochrome c551/c552